MAYIDRSRLPPAIANELSKAIEFLFHSMCLCSFIDSSPENLPMWAFYSNNHKGYCIRYRIEKKELFRKVLYEDNRMPIASIPMHFLEESSKSSKLGYETEELKWYRFILTILFSTKHSSWKAENEYRIWYPANHGCGQNVSNQDLGIIPEDVFLGKDCTGYYKEKIQKICQDNLHCRCWSSDISEEKILDYTPILPWQIKITARYMVITYWSLYLLTDTFYNEPSAVLYFYSSWVYSLFCSSGLVVIKP